jgi:hypothetical protein
MISAFRSRPWPAAPIGTALAAIAAGLMLTGSAAAAVPADGASRASGRSLQTLFTSVRVFKSANTAAAVLGRLGSAGTGVSVSCWTTGTDYGDSPVWYQLTAPTAGYVPAFNLAAHFAPATGIPHCPTPTFSERFNSLETNLRIRTAPSTTATIAGYVVAMGGKVVVNCYVTGGPIFGDAIWYRTSSPAAGYVTGRFMNTGSDPAPGVPHC